MILEKYSQLKRTPITRTDTLEAENAKLWYENMLLKAKADDNEKEIATIWYRLITGGKSNV